MKRCLAFFMNYGRIYVVFLQDGALYHESMEGILSLI